MGREEVLYALLGVDWGADGEVEVGPKAGEEGEEAEVDVGVAVGMEGVDGTEEEEEEEDRGGGEREEEEDPAAFLSLEGSSDSSDSSGGVVSSIGESFFLGVCLVGITTSVLHSAREALPIELELESLSEEVEALRSMVPWKGIGMDCARNGRP